jgi:hypothetical protein
VEDGVRVAALCQVMQPLGRNRSRIDARPTSDGDDDDDDEEGDAG